MKHKFSLAISAAFLLAGGGVSLADELQSPNSSSPSTNSSTSLPSNATTNDGTATYELEAVDITARQPYEHYSSGQGLDKQALESTPSGNGDISSVLKVLPNVQIQNNSRSSNMPGEIDPANISISGGLPYQNSFQLDGFEINNDIDPMGKNSSGWTPHRPRSGHSQGLNVDVSLLESITVLDSNIGAAYGRFSGGVIEANVRKPRTDGWHADFSWQTTNSAMTTQRLYESKFYKLNSTDENWQPVFFKNIFRASLEGYITDRLGLLASFSTARVKIPLQLYDNGTSQETQDQKRVSDNYYIKIYYEPTADLMLEYNFAYMPQSNTYFTPNRRNSAYTQDTGGIQTGLKALWNTNLGLWTNSLGYSRLENSRRADTNVVMPVDGPNKTMDATEGQVGGIDQIQDDLNFKSDFVFTPVEAWRSTHTFRVGVDMIYQHSVYDKFDPTYMYWYSVARNAVAESTDWNGQPDSFGNISATSTHFLPLLGVIRGDKVSLNSFTYGVYGEDDINFNLGSAGQINTRLGVRLDGDDYLKKHKVAPRFSLQYVAPWNREWQTSLTFGANRYYSRNLLMYRYYDKMTNNRTIYYRCSPNDAWTADTTYKDPNRGSGGTMVSMGTLCLDSANITLVNGNKLNSVNFSSALFGTSNLLSDLDVPYDDEFMGAISQNLGGAVNATIKYIHREGKKQIMQKVVGSTNTYNDYEWSNDGYTRSHIITLALKNIVPINTGGVEHYYQGSLDYTNVKRNFITYNDDYDLNNRALLDGQVMAWEDIRQIYKQPLTFKLSTTHAYHFGGKTRLLLNNIFTTRGSYKRVIYESAGGSGTCSANLTAACDTYVTKKFKTSFNWDMRLGIESGNLYVNFDIYNVLDSKNLVPIGLENGGLLYTNIPAQANILAYELGRQFWTQIGYKF